MIRISPFCLGLFIAVLCIGCVSPASLPSTPTPLQTPSPKVYLGKVTITDLNLFEDHYGAQHIVGEVHNVGTVPLQNIMLKVKAADVHGHSILTGPKGESIGKDAFTPFLKILFPGDSSAFEYTIPAINGTVSTYHISVASAKAIVSQKANVTIEHAAIRQSLYGTSFIVGELVNHENSPVKMEGLGSVVLGSQADIRDASLATSQLFYLAPAGDPAGMDSAAFSIPLRGSFAPDTPSRIFLSAVFTEPFEPAPAQVTKTNQYQDSQGTFHLVGTLKNTGPSRATFLLLASLFAADGSVLDTVYCSIPYDLGPGEIFPFDISYWNVINDNPTLQSEIAYATLQVDPSQVVISDLSFDPVTPSGVQQEITEQGNWKFSGTVQNTSTTPYRQIAVVITINDPKGNLVATNYQTITNFTDPIAPGESKPFDIQIDLPPTLSTEGFTFAIHAVGEIAR